MLGSLREIHTILHFQNVDVTAIGLILSGLARCGAWGCFDEFNRLQEATLSVLSMLIQPIQSAIQQKSETVTIFEDPVSVGNLIFATRETNESFHFRFH